MPALSAVPLDDTQQNQIANSHPHRRHVLFAIALATAATMLPSSALRATDGKQSAAGSNRVDPSASVDHAHCSLGSTSVSRCRPQDRRWIVSTRSIDCVKAGETPALVFYYQDATGQWQPSDLASFVAAVGSSRARFWVHGYKVDDAKAIAMGGAAHDALVEAEEPPLQFVIWSWPAEREGLQIRDIRRKACRTITEAYCLAWLWRQLDAKAELSIAGYSYGARVITGGLHIAAGGSLCDLALAADDRQPTGHVRAVLFAAGVDHDALAEGGFHGRALVASESMLSIYTATDRVLKWYHIAVNDRNAKALGYVGIAPLPPPDGCENKFSQMEVSNEIGGAHDWEGYLGSAKIAAAARDTLVHRTTEQAQAGVAKNGAFTTRPATAKPAASAKTAAQPSPTQAATITPVRAANRADATRRVAGAAR